MYIWKKNLFLLVFLFLQINLVAQTYSLHGVVKDAKTGEPLVAATVSACNQITATDLDGMFELVVIEDVCLMEVRYLGYETFSETIQLPMEDGKEFITFLNASNDILNQAVITANKYQQKQSTSTVSLEVIKPQMIALSNSPSADDVLDLVPGVDVIDGQANIRGGSGYSYGAGSRVLLVIDDMPALQFDGGTSQWNDIPTENIQQVEVLKGASSVLYGSSALNGVINFKTAEPSIIPHTKVGVSYRHYLPPEDPKRLWWTEDEDPFELSTYLVHAQKIKKWDFTIGGFYNRLNSYNQSIEEKRGRAYFKTKYRYKSNLFFSLNADINIGDNSTFFYWGNALRKSFQPGENTISKSNITRYKIDPVVTYYDARKDKHVVKGRFYSANNQLDLDQSVKSDFEYLNYTYQRDVEAYDGKMVSGVEGLANQTSAELYSNASYTGYNLAAFLQWNQDIGDKFRYVVGARYELNSLQNPDFTYKVKDETFEVEARNNTEAKPVFRFGLNYEPIKGTYLRGSFGQGYRYPTIAEKFTSTNAGGLVIVPNPDLESETGWSSEIAIRQELKFDFLAMYVDFAGFYSQYYNMMEFTLSSQFLAGFQARNIGNVEMYGIETSTGMQWDLGALQIKSMVAYTFVEPKYLDFTEKQKESGTSSENVLKYRYRHSLKSNISIEIWKLSLWVNQRYNSHMVSIDQNFETFISGIRDFRSVYDKGYNIWSFQLGYQFKHFRVSAHLDNARNVLYTERPALLEAPRNVSIRCEYDISWKTK